MLQSIRSAQLFLVVLLAFVLVFGFVPLLEAASSLTICQPTPDPQLMWQVVARPTEDSIEVQCSQECLDWTQCIQNVITVDYLGNPLQILSFVADGIMAGAIRLNANPPETELRGGLFIHPGGTGIDWPDENRNFWQILEAEGVRVVAVRWLPGGPFDPVTGITYGWFMHKNGHPSTLLERSLPPAEVIQWVHDHLIPAGIKFGTLGSSGGRSPRFQRSTGMDSITSLTTNSSLVWCRCTISMRAVSHGVAWCWEKGSVKMTH
jgi:hypothetical protein